MTASEHLSSRQGAPNPGRSRTLRVLVVDDDRDTVISLLLLLRSEGYEARAAYDAAGTWKSIGEFDPDVVLLDIGLPDRNGYDVARMLRGRLGDMRPVLVAVTAWNKGSDRILSQLAGFDHHLGKPYEPATLLGLLRPIATAIRT
jgi:DNA-binding response OmpR family regulator